MKFGFYEAVAAYYQACSPHASHVQQNMEPLQCRHLGSTYRNSWLLGHSTTVLYGRYTLHVDIVPDWNISWAVTRQVYVVCSHIGYLFELHICLPWKVGNALWKYSTSAAMDNGVSLKIENENNYFSSNEQTVEDRCIESGCYLIMFQRHKVDGAKSVRLLNPCTWSEHKNHALHDSEPT